MYKNPEELFFFSISSIWTSLTFYFFFFFDYEEIGKEKKSYGS